MHKLTAHIQLTPSSPAATAAQTPSMMTRAFPPVPSVVEVRMRDLHPSLLPPTTSINPQTHLPYQLLKMEVRSQPRPLLRLMVETRIFPPEIIRGVTLRRLILLLPDNPPRLLLVTICL